jgi:hypothetical protein
VGPEETLCLLIRQLGIKPDGTMKTLSRTITFKSIALIGFAILATVTIRAFSQSATPRPAPAEGKLTLKFNEAELADSTGAAFKRAVKALKGDQYSLRLKDASGHVEEVTPASGASIKIDKAMTSQLAKSSDAEFTAIGYHVTQTVTSASKTEIQSVLDTLK